MIFLRLVYIAWFTDFLIAYKTHYNVVEKMEQYQIAPEVIDKPPAGHMEVQFRSGKHVRLGTIITPAASKLMPKYVQWKKERFALHCICLIDPDSKSSPGKQFLHWLVVNIRDNKVNTSNTVSSFIGSLPKNGTGFHRYVFLVYKQPHTLNITDPSFEDISESGRGSFSMREFAQKYKLGEPIAGNFYLTEWDRSVPFLEREVVEKYENSNVTVKIV